MGGLHLTGNGKGVVVGITGHTDDQVDIRRGQHGIGLLGGRHLGERRRVAHAQLHIFVEEFLIDTSVVLQHKGVVGVGHDEHVEDALRHQVDERHVFQIEFIPLLWYVVCFVHNHHYRHQLTGHRAASLARPDG